MASSTFSAGMSRPERSRSPAFGTQPNSVSWPPTRAVRAIDDPLQHAHVLAEAGPEELAVLVLAEPVHHGRSSAGAGSAPACRSQCCEVVAHVVAAEGQHRHRVAAHDADLAGRRGGGLRAERRAEEDAVRPVERLEHERHGGRAAAAEDDRGDRHALGIVRRACESAGLLRRRRGEARSSGARPSRSSPSSTGWPCQSVSSSGTSPSLPSHHTSPSLVMRDVGEDGVLGDRSSSRSGWTRSWCPGATPK